MHVCYTKGISTILKQKTNQRGSHEAQLFRCLIKLNNQTRFEKSPNQNSLYIEGALLHCDQQDALCVHFDRVVNLL